MTQAALEAGGAIWTAREIAQQPHMLRATQAGLEQDKEALEGFLAPLLARPDLRIVLAGAGSSAFIGEALAPFLAPLTGYRVEATPTTDIVSAPHLYLDPKRPTLLVSFGRSGNSPESLAAIALVDEKVESAWHLIITCNSTGALADYATRYPAAHLVLMPDATHDRSFAMTSSFTCMMHAAAACLTGVTASGHRTEAIARGVSEVIAQYTPAIRRLAERRFGRVIYVGAAGFRGIAHEAGLKLIEMTNGGAVAIYESTLGFRHGPKAALDKESLVVLFLQNDAYGRRYDLDLLAELRAQKSYGELLVVTTQPVDDLPASQQVVIETLANAQDRDLLAPYIAVAQMLAMFQSLAMGCTPDDPNPSGIVNRVVQGVTIHALA